MSDFKDGSEAVRVSVVIPVYNDATSLDKCLRALREQTYARDEYEVVVVDNASEEDIGAVVAPYDRARIVYEGRRGSYAARNKGVREAEGEIIAFTDADCLPAPSWIEQGVRRLTEDDGCDLVGGRIEFYFEIPGRPTPPELFDSTHYLDQETYVRKQNFAATANAFTWRRLFDDVGLFDDTLRSGGDTEWGRRVKNGGGTICYAEEARVRHPARRTYAALRRKKLRVVEGTVQTRRAHGYPLRGLLLDVVKDLGHHVKFGVSAAAGKSYGWRERIELLGAFSYQGALTAAKRIQLWMESEKDAR